MEISSWCGSISMPIKYQAQGVDDIEVYQMDTSRYFSLVQKIVWQCLLKLEEPWLIVSIFCYGPTTVLDCIPSDWMIGV
jgi:hypothetical protein